MTNTAPPARQCGNARRRKKRRKSTGANAPVEKRTGIDGKRKPDRRPRPRIGEVNERLPEWIVLQAEKAKQKRD
jgi:hypothetical protein